MSHLFMNDILIPEWMTFILKSSSFLRLDFQGFDSTAFLAGLQNIQQVTILACCSIGVFQFIPAIFRKYPNVHFALGNVYVMTVLLIAGPITILKSLFAESLLEMVVSVIWGIGLWVYTRKGIYAISVKKWLVHLECMAISYILAWSVAMQSVMDVKYCLMIFVVLTCLIILLKRKGFAKIWLKSFVNEN